MTVALFKAVLEDVFVGKNVDLLARYLDPEYVESVNGREQGYAAVVAEASEWFAAGVTIHYDYDEDAWVSEVDGAGTGKVAGRWWLTSTMPNQEPTRHEFIAIASFVLGKVKTIRILEYPPVE